MKKIILMLLVLVASINLFAQDLRKINIDDYKLDAKITSILMNETKNMYLHIYQENNEIYVLGWSKDGKIAYVERRLIDGRGGHDLLFTILDLVEDETIYTKTIKWYDDDDEESPVAPLTFKECLNKNAVEFNKELAKNKILLEPVRVLPFPAADSRKNAINFEIKMIKKEVNDFGLEEMSYNIVAKKNNESKIVSKITDKVCSFVMPTGYLKSPYENRIALIVADAEFVYEGCEVFVNFYGCNVNSGFH